MKNWKNKMELIGNEIYFPACWVYACEEGPTTSRPIGFRGGLLESLSWEIAPVVGESEEDVLEFLTELCAPEDDEEEKVEEEEYSEAGE